VRGGGGAAERSEARNVEENGPRTAGRDNTSLAATCNLVFYEQKARLAVT
jgi:hypothetical protein